MKFLIAPDAFKGSLTATEAAAVMAAGVRSVWPHAEIISMPLADGGEGTLDVLRPVYGGIMREGVLYFDIDAEPCALIESARLLGLSLPCMQQDVWQRGSATLGQAMLAALDAGVKNIHIALGGSATVDAGLGLLSALGCRVLDDRGRLVADNLDGMMQAEGMNLDALDQRLKDVTITLFSDVQNPLCGKAGAVYMYGPQKGIVSARLNQVETAMQHWAGLCEQVFACAVMHDVGAGSAGGLGFALKLLGAKLVSGAEHVMHACDFNDKLTGVDWLLTGEGRSDAQTLCGKLPLIASQAARKRAVRVALISGDIAGRPDLLEYFDDVVSARVDGEAVAVAMLQADANLFTAAASWAGRLQER